MVVTFPFVQCVLCTALSIRGRAIACAGVGGGVAVGEAVFYKIPCP